MTNRPSEIDDLLPKLLAAAQSEYDAWQQDENGWDEELGQGGICHLIAEAMSCELNDAGVEAVTTHSEGMGENHVWVTAKTEDGVVRIDISPSFYESGAGYTWRRIPGVVFTSEHLEVFTIDRDPENYYLYAGDKSDFLP